LRDSANRRLFLPEDVERVARERQERRDNQHSVSSAA
jgi:hypothetical protein